MVESYFALIGKHLKRRQKALKNLLNQTEFLHSQLGKEFDPVSVVVKLDDYLKSMAEW